MRMDWKHWARLSCSVLLHAAAAAILTIALFGLSWNGAFSRPAGRNCFWISVLVASILAVLKSAPASRPRLDNSEVAVSNRCSTGRRARLRMSLIALIVLIPVFGFTCIELGMSRWYHVGAYVRPYDYYFLENKPVPDSILQIENDYNHWKGRHYTIPMYPGAPRPTYVPPKDDDMPRMVFIESKPDGLAWMLTRWVVYARRGGPTERMESIWEWELDDRLREDATVPTASD